MHADVIDDIAAVDRLNYLALMMRTLIITAEKFGVFLLFDTALRVIFS
jgi:hypothetical protein